jgi:hypothetical protein
MKIDGFRAYVVQSIEGVLLFAKAISRTNATVK